LLNRYKEHSGKAVMHTIRKK